MLIRIPNYMANKQFDGKNDKFIVNQFDFTILGNSKSFHGRDGDYAFAVKETEDAVTVFYTGEGRFEKIGSYHITPRKKLTIFHTPTGKIEVRQ